MKSSIILLLVISPFISKSTANQHPRTSTDNLYPFHYLNEQDRLNIIGTWHWRSEDKTKEFTIKIKKITKDSVYAQYCAVSRNGNKLDCDFEDINNLRGIIKNNKVLFDFYSFFGAKNGKAEIEINNNQLKWKILKAPKGEYYAPDSVFLVKKEDKHLISNNKPSETRKVISNSKKYVVPNGFCIHDSVFVRTNNSTYEIIALEKKQNRNNKGNWYFGLPIIVLKIDNNNSYELFKNDSIVFKFNDNCPADGYSAIVSKNKYFTIEQSSCLDFMFVYSYSTFRIDDKTNNIYLHKYSEEYSDRSDPDRKIPVKIWSTKDFGVVNFEDVTETFLNKLRNIN